MWRFTCSYSRATSKPATVARPSLGCDSPHSILIAVVLPAPFAPRNPNISPSCTSNVMWFVATKSPNCFVSPSALITILSVIMR